MTDPVEEPTREAAAEIARTTPAGGADGVSDGALPPGPCAVVPVTPGSPWGKSPGAGTQGARRRWLPVAALILLALIWGYAWVVMKIALDYVDPFTFSALRTFPAALLLLAILPLLKRPVRPKAFWPTALLGLLQTTGFIALMTWALQGQGAGKTSILTYTMPFWVLLMAWVVLGEKLKGFQWVAVALALCGLILILQPWHLQGGFSDLLAVGGALSWAGSAVYAKVLRKHHEVDLLSLTAWQLLLGSIPLVIMAAATWTAPPVWTGTFIWALVYCIVLGSGVAWVLWLYIVDSLRAGTAGLASLLNPVIGIASAWIQLGERPGLLEGLGMISIVGALLLVVLRELLRGRRSG
ncbi:MAG: DMT family transporter [Actinobacteria bacterium]|nr:DMT family transporter [Actinomycetota bacterium]